MKVHVKTKNVTLSPADNRILERLISRTRKKLKTFDPDLVHLDLTVEKHARRAEFTGSLRLFVVNSMLTAKRNSGDTATALFQEAFKDIDDQLDRFKSDLRGEAARKRHRSTRDFAPLAPEPEVPAGD